MVRTAHALTALAVTVLVTLTGVTGAAAAVPAGKTTTPQRYMNGACAALSDWVGPHRSRTKKSWRPRIRCPAAR